MGTATSSLGSTSTGLSSIPTFNGTSEYASQLQAVITNAVNAASEPITELQNEQTALTNQSNEVSTLDGDFTSLQTAIEGIQSALGGSSMTADVSDPTVISATLGDGAIPGNYSIQSDDLGAYSTTLTNTWTGTSSGTVDTYVLSIGSQSYNITPTDNSATSVASAINSQYGNLVQATVVNVGSNSSPDYRISLQSTNLTSDTIDLTDNGTSTAAVQTAGAPAQYEINNSGTVVSSDSRTVDVATGVTLNLLSTSSSPVEVDVTQDPSALSNAVSAFVSAYNTAQTELNNQRGSNGGPLQGNALVNELQQVLDGLITYSPMGNSTVNGWTDLGVTFSDTGDDTVNTLTFDASTLESAESSSPSAVAAFLGSVPSDASSTSVASKTGSGFLLSATDTMTSLEDPTSGLLKTTENNYTTQLSNLATQISNKQAQVNQLQTSLTNQMNSADAMINSLEQQYTDLTDMLQAEQIDDESYHS
jgi:flagellar hook-associated protein 2